MSWEPEVLVGGNRPFPEAVQAVKAMTGERVRYVPERTTWKVKAEEPTPDGGSYECLVCSRCDEWLAPEDCDGPGDGPAWCEHCGARILGTLRCGKCGEVMWSDGGDGYASCTCGAKVEGEEE